MKTVRILTLPLLLAACASSQEPTARTATVATTTVAARAPAAVVDPVGSYEFSTSVDGQAVTGTMHVEGAPGNYKGRILTTVFPEIPITSATAEGNNLILKGSLPEGELTIRIATTGSEFKGNWSLGADRGEISGRKLPE